MSSKWHCAPEFSFLKIWPEDSAGLITVWARHWHVSLHSLPVRSVCCRCADGMVGPPDCVRACLQVLGCALACLDPPSWRDPSRG